MSEKQWCPGTTYDERLEHFSQKTLYRCKTCKRVHKTTRRHTVRSKATASHDKTMEGLWSFAWERR